MVFVECPELFGFAFTVWSFLNFLFRPLSLLVASFLELGGAVSTAFAAFLGSNFSSSMELQHFDAICSILELEARVGFRVYLGLVKVFLGLVLGFT